MEQKRWPGEVRCGDAGRRPQQLRRMLEPVDLQEHKLAGDLLPGAPSPGVYEPASHWEIKASYRAVAARQGVPPPGFNQQEKFGSWVLEGCAPQLSLSALLRSAGRVNAPGLRKRAGERQGKRCPQSRHSVCQVESAVAISVSTQRVGGTAVVVQRELAPVMYTEADRWGIDCQQITSVPSGRASSHGRFRDLISRDLCSRSPVVPQSSNHKPVGLTVSSGRTQA